MKHFLTGLILIAAAALSAQMKIVGTTLPVTAVTKAVLSGVPGAEISVLLPEIAGCPHDYSLTPADMKRLTGANIIVINGGGMEGFLDGVIERICPKAQIADASKGILSDCKKHSCGHKHCHHGHGHHAENEHILAAPALAAKAIRSVGNQFCSFPELAGSAEKIQQNTKEFTAKLEKISADYASFASVLPDHKKRVLAQHSIFDYLAKEAGFSVEGYIFEHDLQEPSAAEAAKLLRLIKTEKIFAILAEPGEKSRMTEMLSRESGIPVIYLNVNPKTDSPEELLKLFSDDLEILKKAIQ